MTALQTVYQHQSGAFEAEKSAEYSRSICLEDGLLAYALMSAQGRIVAVKEYRAALGASQMLAAALAADPILSGKFTATTVFSSAIAAALVPVAELAGENKFDYARHLLAADSTTHFVETVAVPSIQAEAVCTIPVWLSSACVALGEVKWRPLAAAAVPMALMVAGKYPSLLLLTSCGNQALIAAVKDRKLQFCNAADAGSAEDLLYFAELAVSTAGLSQAGAPVFFTGITDAQEKRNEALKGYIPALQFPVQELSGAFETQSDKLPVWKYAFLSF